MRNEPEPMAKIKPPRALRVKFRRGSMFGEPGNVERQDASSWIPLVVYIGD
jgi:hypothetical protein